MKPHRADIEDAQYHVCIIRIAVAEAERAKNVNLAGKLHAAADYLQSIVDRMKSQRERAA